MRCKRPCPEAKHIHVLLFGLDLCDEGQLNLGLSYCLLKLERNEHTTFEWERGRICQQIKADAVFFTEPDALFGQRCWWNYKSCIQLGTSFTVLVKENSEQAG